LRKMSRDAFPEVVEAAKAALKAHKSRS
jgi:hypothetical protein